MFFGREGLCEMYPGVWFGFNTLGENAASSKGAGGMSVDIPLGLCAVPSCGVENGQRPALSLCRRPDPRQTARAAGAHELPVCTEGRDARIPAAPRCWLCLGQTSAVAP